MEKRPALGKGLSALIPDAADALSTPRATLDVDIDLLEANDYQPRGAMDDSKLEELARSIRANGIIQPIVVRKLANAGTGRDRYQIIAGERRWRAAQRAQLTKVPIVIKDIASGDKKRQLEMALVENIQREDLNPMEAAAGYQQLVDEFRLSHDQISAQVGKDRATVANYIRLLKLPEEVRGNVASGAISMGHARAIVALATEADQKRLARDVVSRGLSVRETEALVKGELARKQPEAEKKAGAKKDVHTRAAEEQLHLALGTTVEIKRRGKGGTIAISFSNEAELQRIYEYLTEKK
jgi:ParB family chromosome partitioning protein